MERINNVSRIVMTQEKFGKDFYLKIAQQLQLLIEAEHLCSVYMLPKKKDVVVIEFVSAIPNFSEPYPYYLYPDEAGYVSLYVAKKNLAHNENEVKRLKDVIEDIENSNLAEVVDALIGDIKDADDNKGGKLN